MALAGSGWKEDTERHAAFCTGALMRVLLDDAIKRLDLLYELHLGGWISVLGSFDTKSLSCPDGYSHVPVQRRYHRVLTSIDDGYVGK